MDSAAYRMHTRQEIGLCAVIGKCVYSTGQIQSREGKLLRTTARSQVEKITTRTKKEVDHMKQEYCNQSSDRPTWNESTGIRSTGERVTTMQGPRNKNR